MSVFAGVLALRGHPAAPAVWIGRGGWFDAADRWRDAEFFRSQITDFRLVT